MVNYNLEEFKRWLEADESRYELNGVNKTMWVSNLQNIQEDDCFDYLIELKDFNSRRHRFQTNEGWKPLRQTVLQWKAEVDEREREREREQKGAIW